MSLNSTSVTVMGSTGHDSMLVSPDGRIQGCIQVTGKGVGQVTPSFQYHELITHCFKGCDMRCGLLWRGCGRKYRVWLQVMVSSSSSCVC